MEVHEFIIPVLFLHAIVEDKTGIFIKTVDTDTQVRTRNKK